MDKFLARVIGTHPDTGTVDVEAIRTGWKMRGVFVMVGPSTSRAGNAGMPEFSDGDPGIAVVETIDGVPVVTGFLPSRISQLRFADGRTILRHDSDVYVSLGRDGEVELYHPSGAMIRIGEGEAHEDLTGADFDREWKLARNTGKAVKMVFQVGPTKITLSDTGLRIETPELDIIEA